MASAPARYDLAVIGAGVNGAGIARDAALRGLSVIILDKADTCSGTSWASSRLIHGGLRYLEYGEVPLVFESLRERRTLRRIAPHLVDPLRLCIPIYSGARRGKWLIRLGLTAYDILSIGKSLPGHDMLSRAEILADTPGLEREGLRGAARYYDAQVTYAERLVLENLLGAKAAGAKVCTYSPVTAIDVDDDSPRVVYHDGDTARDTLVEAHAVVNAAGPWVDEVLATTGRESSRLIGGTKGSHLVVSRFEGAPRDAFYVEAASDGRPYFILPWNDLFLIGTTDIRYDGDPGDTRPDAAEVDYLLGETNRVFPAARLTRADVHYGYSGVRPLPYRAQGPESAITRRHIITEAPVPGRRLLSIVGGKLTTYRELAEQVVDRVGEMLGRDLDASTSGTLPLPGAAGLNEARAALQASGHLGPDAIDRLVAVYGGRAAGIAALADADPRLARCLDAAGRVPAAEIVFVAREEMPGSLSDVLFRRTMLGLDADQGRGCYEQIAAVTAAELGWDEQRRHAELAALRGFADSLRIA